MHARPYCLFMTQRMGRRATRRQAMTRSLASIEITRTYTCNGVSGVVYTLKGVGRCSTLLKAGQTLREAITPEPQGLNLCRNEAITDTGEIRCEQMRGVNAYLAQITGRCPRYGLRRAFVRADESDLSRAGNGRLSWDVSGLEPGVYEAQSTWRSMTAHRTYFTVDCAGQIEIIEKRDALAMAA